MLGFEVPVVDGRVVIRTGNITEKLRAPVVGIVLKELRPVSAWAIDSFEPRLTSRLDFELPEDYKRRCPIFRSRIIAFQRNFMRGSLVC